MAGWADIFPELDSPPYLHFTLCCMEPNYLYCTIHYIVYSTVHCILHYRLYKHQSGWLRPNSWEMLFSLLLIHYGQTLHCTVYCTLLLTVLYYWLYCKLVCTVYYSEQCIVFTVWRKQSCWLSWPNPCGTLIFLPSIHLQCTFYFLIHRDQYNVE